MLFCLTFACLSDPISQVEQEEMPRILSEAAGDAQKSGVSLRCSSKLLCTIKLNNCRCLILRIYV